MHLLTGRPRKTRLLRHTLLILLHVIRLHLRAGVLTIVRLEVALVGEIIVRVVPILIVLIPFAVLVTAHGRRLHIFSCTLIARLLR